MSSYKMFVHKLPHRIRAEIKFRPERFLPLHLQGELGQVRRPQDVARRAVILYSVSCETQKLRKRKELRAWLEAEDLWKEATPNEQAFLTSEDPSHRSIVRFSWKCEAALVLLWSLGVVEELLAPESAVEMTELEQLLPRIGESTLEFVNSAKLRSADEILDFTSIVFQMRSAIEHYMSNNWGQKIVNLPIIIDTPPPEGDPNIPGGLDPEIAFEWHYALNWLTLYGEQEWDDVTTDT